MSDIAESRPDIQPFMPRYEILRRLGRGGSATVYMVRDTRDGAIKALKALKHQQLADSATVARFEDEFRIMSGLHHPGLPEVFDYGITDDGSRYIVMEFIDGEPVTDYATTHPGELWLLVYQLAESLAFIHEHGLLHLDLKPANVLVRRSSAFGDGETPVVTLLDFGLSYRREDDWKTSLVGTPAYMAPEIILGKENPTRATDYYSLGITLFELLEGELPFQGSFDDVLDAHLTKTITFSQRNVDFAPLYAHVKNLTLRDQKRRLETFDDFRRTVADHVGSELRGLDRAYGLGYLNSFGVIGKKDAWATIREWSKRLGAMFGAGALEPPAPEPDTGEDDGEDALRTTMRLGETPEPRPVPAILESRGSYTDGVVTDMSRGLAISGAGGSGKSFIVESLRSEAQMRGLWVALLRDERAYDALVHDDTGVARDAAGVDPGSVIIDRFVRGWERIMERAARGGALVILDGHDVAPKEVRDFFEYCCNRLGFMMNAGVEPQLFLVVTGRNPNLHGDVQAMLPQAAIEDIVIPPPRSEDVEAILATFHGKTTGADDRRALRDYLIRGGDTAGALVERLKEAFVRGDLDRTHGRWQFRMAATGDGDASASREDYFRLVLDKLERHERAIIEFLACHKQALYVDDLLELSGMSTWDILEALERVRPYRVLERVRDAFGERVELVSEAVRKAFYNTIEPARRKDLHSRFVDYFVDRADPAHMAYHYRKAGLHKQALGAMIAALRRLRADGDVFGVRQICAEGVKLVRSLDDARWAGRRWHLERYFIKQWLHAEWTVNNYAGIVDLVRTHVIGRRRTLPLGFYYPYGASLEKQGDFTACRKLIAAGKRALPGRLSVTYCKLLLLEASVLATRGEFTRSLQTLDTVKAAAGRLDDAARARLFVQYMIDYEAVGNKPASQRYQRMARELAERIGDFDQLLQVSYTQIMYWFNSSLYEQARQGLCKAIRLANKHRLYHQLSAMYYLASAVYFEEGNYRSAIRYLDKAIRVALNTGMRLRVNDYQLRYALIYQNMGQYSNALRLAESASVEAAEEHGPEQHFFSLLVLFDLYTSLRNSKALTVKERLATMVKVTRTKHLVAYYHHLLGCYHRNSHDAEGALASFATARRMYESIGYEDDAARSGLEMVTLHMKSGDARKAKALLDRIDGQVYRMESTDLRIECAMAHLRYLRRFQPGHETTTRILEQCDQARPRISNVNVALQLDALLFECFLEANDTPRSVEYFESFQMIVREIVSGLPDPDLRDQFLAHPDIMSVFRLRREGRRKKPEHQRR